MIYEEKNMTCSMLVCYSELNLNYIFSVFQMKILLIQLEIFVFFVKSMSFTASGLYEKPILWSTNDDDKMMCVMDFFFNIQNFKKFVIGFSSI